MSKLTLDEAIKHCLEVAEQKEHDSITTTGDHELDIAMKEGCIQCAKNHRQIAEWLMEYKDLKAEQNDQYVFIHELMSELKESKRFLKAAVDDLKFESQCRNCKYQQTGLNNICNGCRGNKYEWRYGDEALKLIGDENDAE